MVQVRVNGGVTFRTLAALSSQASKYIIMSARIHFLKTVKAVTCVCDVSASWTVKTSSLFFCNLGFLENFALFANIWFSRNFADKKLALFHTPHSFWLPFAKFIFAKKCEMSHKGMRRKIFAKFCTFSQFLINKLILNCDRRNHFSKSKFIFNNV